MFVERTSRDGQEVVVLPYAALFYWLVWPTIALTALASVIPSTPLTIATGIVWGLLLAVAFPHWTSIVEIKRQMGDSAVTCSGSKYSFKNPLTYRWPQSTED